MSIHTPPVRRLQVYAFDPSLDLDLETMAVNRSVVRVDWEDVGKGPVGEYVEVIDVDPASDSVYEPIDLNDRHLLAQDGLPPSEGNPQFHQQMVYAVAMLTIANFERALGRNVHWSPRSRDEQDREIRDHRRQFVRRLRIHPHALREPNAYYSPHKKALLFGYFNAQNVDPREGLPGGMVFSCLSHDIVAHETTHAILDGIHRRMIEPTNDDMLAFHEAFADIVAIFQHFTLPDVLEHQIARTRGDLETENLLAQLAVQFGRATGRGNQALRDALGAVNPATGRWERRQPDPERIDRTHEPHARGALLVASIFDAFLTIYQHHTADLRRIATGGSGVLPEGELHPDLVNRFAREARKVAQRILTICIRALDYLPPVDVTFGDYVRALITGDLEIVPDDKRHYRVALISAFRDSGIYPRDARTLSVESLRWDPPDAAQQEILRQLLPPLDVIRTMTTAQDYVARSLTAEDLTAAYGALSPRSRASSQKRREEQGPRGNEFLRERQFAALWHDIVHNRARRSRFKPADWQQVEWMMGLDLRADEPFEVHAVRPFHRMRPDGRTKTELLVMITQRRRERLPFDTADSRDDLEYLFRGGCTLLIDPEDGDVRYAISKNINSPTRVPRQRAFYRERLRFEGLNARARYWLRRRDERPVPHESFAMLHRSDSLEDWS